ncbi:MAG: hypothetical protein HC769_16520 [Cyanobacteria bacterium CRU_2_1]|nr:hypothetical protein [Cyanobacteria bacterium CRU_2_1]
MQRVVWPDDRNDVGLPRSMATTWGLFLLRCYCSSTIAVLMSHSGRSNVSGS